MVVTKEEALELFADNPFKIDILSTKVADGTRTTVYKCGDLIDLCRGPHVSHTGKIKAFATTRHSATNWLGDTDNDSLQRMYGISFPDKKQLKVWQDNMEKVGLLVANLFLRILHLYICFSSVFGEQQSYLRAMMKTYSNLILGVNNDDNISIPLILLSTIYGIISVVPSSRQNMPLF